MQVATCSVTRALPLGYMQGLQWKPPAPVQGPPAAYKLWHIRFQQGPLKQLIRGSPNMKRLLVTTAGCGGLDSDPRKVPRLIAYLVYTEPDIVHLRELGPTFMLAWLCGLLYAMKVGPLFAGGGLAALLHHWIVSKAQVKAHPQEHSLCVKVEPAWGVTVAAVNLHLPPSLPDSWHCAVPSGAVAFLTTTGAGVQMPEGGLNKSLGPQGGGRLS